MNAFQRKQTIDLDLLQDCLVKSLLELKYAGDCAGTAELIVKQLMLADESLRGQLFDDLLAAMHDIYDGAGRQEARTRFDRAVDNALNGRVAGAANDFLSALLQDQVDPLLTMIRLAAASAKGSVEEDLGAILRKLDRPQLSRLYENLEATSAMSSTLEELIGALRGRVGNAPLVVKYQNLLSAMKANLDATWKKTCQHLEKKDVRMLSDNGDSSQRDQLQLALRSTLYDVLAGEETDPAQILEREVSQLR